MTQLKDCFITSELPYVEGRVDVFRQVIRVKEDCTAQLVITALGVFEAQMNGEKIGDRLLAPGFTYYPARLQYESFKVALHKGENEFVVYLGQGWYCGRFTFDNKTQLYGEKPAAAWTIDTPDGEFSSREGVEEMNSPYDYAGLYDGEIYRAGRLHASGRRPVPFKGKLSETLVPERCGVRLREAMPVQQIIKREDGCVLDFGQNFAGVLTIDPAHMHGKVLKIRHGEILDENGALYTANLRKAKQELVYYRDEFDEENKPYTPRFTYMGFRYAEITGVPYEEGLITAHAVYSDMKRTGWFSSENVEVNRLYQNQLWSNKSNYVEVPTDCPQRDERMGYTGDAHVFARTASYNFDTRDFLEKFLQDMADSQPGRKGYIPSTVPDFKGQGGFLTMQGWGNAITLIPEMLYWQFGDPAFLTDRYGNMKQFTDYEIRKAGLTHLWTGLNLGDWLTPGRDIRYMAGHNGAVSNAFFVHDLKTVIFTARLLGNKKDEKRYRQELEKVTRAYEKHFINPDGSMKDDYQGAAILALALVLPEGELRAKVYRQLTGRIRREGMQTGFFSTQYVLGLLADNGDAKLAYDLLLQESCPGWMYEVKRGATTMWERWDAIRPDGTVNETKMSSDNMVSFNHYAFGSVGEFYYQYILGIRPLTPGFETIAIRPFMDERLGHVKGTYESVRGKIQVEWELSHGKWLLSVTTPAGADVTMPDGRNVHISAGSVLETGTVNEEGSTHEV